MGYLKPTWCFGNFAFLAHFSIGSEKCQAETWVSRLQHPRKEENDDAKKSVQVSIDDDQEVLQKYLFLLTAPESRDDWDFFEWEGPGAGFADFFSGDVLDLSGTVLSTAFCNKSAYQRRSRNARHLIYRWVVLLRAWFEWARGRAGFCAWVGGGGLSTTMMKSLLTQRKRRHMNSGWGEGPGSSRGGSQVGGGGVRWPPMTTCTWLCKRLVGGGVFHSDNTHDPMMMTTNNRGWGYLPRRRQMSPWGRPQPRSDKNYHNDSNGRLTLTDPSV